MPTVVTTPWPDRLEEMAAQLLKAPAPQPLGAYDAVDLEAAAKRIRTLECNRDEYLGLLDRCYRSAELTRDGWKEGPTSHEVLERIEAALRKAGRDPNREQSGTDDEPKAEYAVTSDGSQGVKLGVPGRDPDPKATAVIEAPPAKVFPMCLAHLAMVCLVEAGVPADLSFARVLIARGDVSHLGKVITDPDAFVECQAGDAVAVTYMGQTFDIILIPAEEESKS